MLILEILAIPIVLRILIQLWVRFAPNDPRRWHVDPAAQPWPGMKGYRKELDFDLPPDQLLGALDKIIRATARTRRIAGDVQERRISYETRSALWGFPDYTTISADSVGGKTRLTILGRLRFGRGDLGVNRIRIKRWIKDLVAVVD